MSFIFVHLPTLNILKPWPMKCALIFCISSANLSSVTKCMLGWGQIFQHVTVAKSNGDWWSLFSRKTLHQSYSQSPRHDKAMNPQIAHIHLRILQIQMSTVHKMPLWKCIQNATPYMVSKRLVLRPETTKSNVDVKTVCWNTWRTRSFCASVVSNNKGPL